MKRSCDNNIINGVRQAGQLAILSAIPFSFMPNRVIFSQLVKGSTHQARPLARPNPHPRARA